ncbi:DNA repair protein Rad26 [Emericellopsis atlantica]|uniref:DNA repair protein Rad26 n=1 Tax=Emericellopsis atlantica TaxID=2614577 RepID=A0A9P7ZVW8_9HYPO|nr:DNA repair protein Rad26 [Emericellopsis atlantica]KAG9258817.1 DNA repair protein Rad26 [Emericellopsis atlantica]
MDLDEFSDDGFDDLPDNALQELENNAISLTQAHQHTQHQDRFPPARQQPQRAFSDYGWDEDDDLDTSEVINPAGAPLGRPLVDNSLLKQPQQAPAQRPPIPPNPNWNPMINPDSRANTPVAARSQYVPQQATGIGRPQTSHFTKPTLPSHHFGPSQASQQPSNLNENVFSALQQRVRALEGELNAAKGEISIIRANSTKADLEHSAEVARLRRTNAEQIARQEKMVEAAVAAEKTASTELQFLQQDMRDATHRPKRRETSRTGRDSQATTPKKSTKSWNVADGFDGMEIASPSKGQGRGRGGAGSVAVHVGERTPSKNKRKRPTMDSPVTALETHTDDIVMVDRPATAQSVPPAAAVAAMAPAPLFEFLQLVLDHASFHSEPPTFDLLARYSFPSDPGASMATHIFQTLPMMGHPQRPMQLLVDFAEHVVGLWNRAFNEELWQPIKYLVALVTFTLQLHTTYVAPLIVTNLANVAQVTIRKLAEGRHRLPDGDLSNSDEYRYLEQDIDTTNLMSLLHACSLACVTTIMETDHGTELKIVDFWRLMSLDFVTLLLTPKQKADDIIGMLEMLATSSLPDSIGPILDDKEPAFVARLVIERVSAKLVEAPLSATTEAEKRSIRVSALKCLLAFARYPFGAQQLAAHDNALPRTVTCLSAAIDSLYDMSIPSHVLPQDSDAPPDTSSPAVVLYRIISQCVLLLHTLITDTPDIAQKLGVAYGCSQRYLIALGRLTFAEEDLVMEAGIEGWVVEMAHELLEMAVTPDEGETVSQVFGGL